MARQGDLFGGPPPAAPAAEPKKPVQAPVVKPIEPPAVARTPAWRRMEAPAPAEPEKKAEAPTVWSVSQLTQKLKKVLEPAFGRVLVRGEISNFRENARGHLYFALKDARASIDVKLWATTAQRLKFKLREGLSVIVEGSLDVYEPQGRYSLIVDRIEPEGVGAQALAFEQLKQKLTTEGLIGEQRKRPRRELPYLPRRIGVVTSITGAALRDFLHVLHRRHPGIAVLVADARVQGDGAIFEIRRALRWMCRQQVDVIVLTRGGGSADDLWTFNEEPLVRAVWDCTVPVVSAVGHEIDVTLCDLVADVRAPTPSAAAELLAPPLVELRANVATPRARMTSPVERTGLAGRRALRELKNRLGDPRRQLSGQRLFLATSTDRLRAVLHRRVKHEGAALRALSQRLQRARPQAQLAERRDRLQSLRTRLVAQGPRRLAEEHQRLQGLARRLERNSPQPRLRQERERLERLDQRVRLSLRERLRRDQQSLRSLAAHLDALSPLKVLGRGYALVTRDGAVVRSAGEVKPGDQLSLKLERGRLEVQVISAHEPD